MEFGLNKSILSLMRGARSAAPLIGRTVAITLLATGVLVLPGCKTSQTLTELLFDQNAQDTDKDNASRFLRNVLDSLDMTEELAQMLERETELEREVQNDEAVQGEDKSKDEVAKSDYDELSYSDSQTTESGSGTETSSSEKTGKNNGSSSKDGKKNSKDDGDDKKDAEGGASETGDEGDGTIYHGDGGTGDVYGEDGTYTELPDGVQTVVAFGECANMVVSFAGEHALAGADADFLSNSFIKTAYKSKDIANAKVIKTSSEGSIDVEGVIELEPDAILLSGTSYTLDKSDKAQLEEAKIDVVYLPAMTSATRIVKVADAIGDMFGNDTLSGDNARKKADAYISWHDEVVSSTKSINGGLAGSTNFDTGKGCSGPTGTYTLYIDQWDNATYYATPDDTLSWTDKKGVAVSKVGYKWSPMSYYLSAGGTQNVSATFKSPFYDTTALYYVWQFNLGRVPTVYDKNWSGRSVTTSALSNSGTSDLLVKASDGTTLGSEKFPYVIASTQTVAAKMKASVDNANKKGKGIYATYGTVTGTDGKGGIGFLSGSGQYCSAAISGSFDVLTNPCGLYSSWIDGSPESVLESVWISDINNDTSTLSAHIKDFYELFYDVELTSDQVKTIIAGAEK